MIDMVKKFFSIKTERKNNAKYLTFKFLGLKCSVRIKSLALKNELQIIKNKIDLLQEKQNTENFFIKGLLRDLLLRQNYPSLEKVKVSGNVEEYFKKCVLFQHNHITNDGVVGINLGDCVQTLAVRNLMRKLYPDVSLEYFDVFNLANYQNGKAFTIMNNYFSHEDCYSFLPNQNLLPIYIGAHFSESKQKDIMKLLQYMPDLFKNETVGCRDLYTKQFFQNLNIDAYFSRCLTLTFPKRESSKTQNKVFIVNVLSDFVNYFPKEIVKDAEYINQQRVDADLSPSHYIKNAQAYIKMTEDLFSRYKNEAKLVITSALHCAIPCIAMGIPTVVICADTSSVGYRFEALKGIVPIYTKEDVLKRKINFNPSIPDIEDLKDMMIKNLKYTIAQRKGEKINQVELAKIRSDIENYNILTD